MKSITDHIEWNQLSQHFDEISGKRMQDWFKENPDRFDHFSLKVEGLFLDFSKNRIDKNTLPLLINFANSLNLKEKISNLVSGFPLNFSEKKPALHTALRREKSNSLPLQGHDIMPSIQASLDQMRLISASTGEGKRLGCTGKSISTIVNIGIGGSHLGAKMAIEALKDFCNPKLTCHFISNIDSAHLHDVLQQIDPEKTLFIVSSKSFTTLETLTHAKSIWHWLKEKFPQNPIEKQFIAVTAAPEKAAAFGILPENIIPIWEWVGGRYSIWSAVGLPLAIMIGMDAFTEFLAGARAMDEHFQTAPFEKNMPVILALLGIWYINFFGAKNHAIIPYSHKLDSLQNYLQQADMESNGKHMTQQGKPASYETGPIVWGEQGSNGQHAFHQLLHQGNHLVPVDFHLIGKNKHAFDLHYDILIASALSQSQALMEGKNYDAALKELLSAGFSQEDAAFLASHKVIPGNRPSNTFIMDEMTPYNLGLLLALYEHKIFVQGAIWDINSFDQWGVELGKQLLPTILEDLTNNIFSETLDASTRGLIAHLKKTKAMS